ncbi:conjugal transfer protein MobB [Porphyromonas somerae]|uniref:conjugal transfer protein MobB n=1 Tax=Porphyromonas somerae TaxID=322095 RepID=UPI002A80FDC3|nr:conjugal transfer protein MobB [Porphyromonas somerae]MDY3884356.1 conjugal transfer protein MobB [Porphyromonas somerae]
MIAKISATANLGGTLGYNFKKVEQKEASVLLANGLYQQSGKPYTMEQVFEDMQLAIPDKCRTKKVVFHCSLNPHPDEHLDEETLRAIAKEYMEELGYGKQPYIVFKHSDIAREHIHIVSLRIDSGGVKVNDRFEKWRSKRITTALEEKYSLIPSSKKSVKEKRSLLPIAVDVERGDIKQQIEGVMRFVLKHYAFQSLGELNAALAQYRLTAEEVKREYRGKQYDGVVYVSTDGSGNKVGTPIHASEIGRGVGYDALERRMEQSKSLIATHLGTVRGRLLEVMRSSPQGIEEFQKGLEQVGLRAFIRRSDNGRLYGITFIDDKHGIVVNGSRLGKGYSANVFNSYFDNPDFNPFLDETLYHSPKIPEQSIEEPKSIALEENHSDELIGDVIGELIDELPINSGNDDWKETAWQRKLRRQNRPRLKGKRR